MPGRNQQELPCGISGSRNRSLCFRFCQLIVAGWLVFVRNSWGLSQPSRATLRYSREDCVHSEVSIRAGHNKHGYLAHLGYLLWLRIYARNLVAKQGEASCKSAALAMVLGNVAGFPHLFGFVSLQCNVSSLYTALLLRSCRSRRARTKHCCNR